MDKDDEIELPSTAIILDKRELRVVQRPMSSDEQLDRFKEATELLAEAERLEAQAKEDNRKATNNAKALRDRATDDLNFAKRGVLGEDVECNVWIDAKERRAYLVNPLSGIVCATRPARTDELQTELELPEHDDSSVDDTTDRREKLKYFLSQRTDAEAVDKFGADAVRALLNDRIIEQSTIKVRRRNTNVYVLSERGVDEMNGEL